MEHKFEKYFTEEEWENFKKNVNNIGRIPLEDYLNIEHYDLGDFLLSSFLWYKSEERFDYWDKISQRTEPVR